MLIEKDLRSTGLGLDCQASVHLPGVEVGVALDLHDGLRGFEITDPDGHIPFFGRPRKQASIWFVVPKIPSFSATRGPYLRQIQMSGSGCSLDFGNGIFLRKLFLK
jgi:hypothetical protein